MSDLETFEYHRFLDEAGDTTFYGKGKTHIIGKEGVSKCFILGMLKVKEPLNSVREKIIDLQNHISSDSYFKGIPSIEKKIKNGGYFLHAKDDVPEVRKMGYDLIKSLDCSFEAIVARKIYSVYENFHHGNEAEFYADLLSHILKNKFKKYEKLVLNIAERSKCTTHTNLELGLKRSFIRFEKKHNKEDRKCSVVFNVQKPTREPLLNLADYFCWALQRLFERGEMRFYEYISDQVAMVNDLYDEANYSKGKNIYNRRTKLTVKNHLK